MMNLDVVKMDFNGYDVPVFYWKDRPCVIANQLLELFGYTNVSVAMNQCIEVEEFELGKEYDKLSGEDLKEFKRTVEEVISLKLTTSEDEVISKFAPHLIVLYEDGIFGFLSYSDKPIGVKFRKWLRNDVLPQLKDHSEYRLWCKGQRNPNRNNYLMHQGLIDLREPVEVWPKRENVDLAIKLTKQMAEIVDQSGMDSLEKVRGMMSIYHGLGIPLDLKMVRKPVVEALSSESYEFEEVDEPGVNPQ